MKWLYEMWCSKSIIQRIYIIIFLFLLLLFLFFMIKGNFFDNANVTDTQSNVTSTAEAESDEAAGEIVPGTNADKPNSQISFHISLWDVGILLAVVIAYLIHKYKERNKEKR